MLSASVPPDVKNILPGDVFNKLAIVFLALSTTILDSLPKECI